MISRLKCSITGEPASMTRLRHDDRIFIMNVMRECSITGDSMAFHLIRAEEDLAEAYIRRSGLMKVRRTLRRLMARMLAMDFKSWELNWRDSLG